MRILQLVAQTVLGGAETYGFNLAAELARRGHQTLLLGNRANGPLLEKPHPEGMRVRALHRKGRLDPRILSFLLGAIREFRPDVIHAHNFEASAWARALGALFPRLVVATHVHSGRMVVRHPAHRIRIDRILNRRADLVIVLNQEQEVYVRERLGVPSERLRVMPNGIDTQRFRPREEAASSAAGLAPDADAAHPVSMISVASLTDVKNHDGLLDAFISLAPRHPGLRLILVGDGPLRDDLESKCREASVADRVEFAGLQHDVSAFLSRASIFVLPSHREALPLSLLEAMATGLPSVASRVGGIPEVVEDGRHGLLVEPGDTQALAAAIERLCGDPPLRRTMGDESRQRVVERFSLEAAADNLVDEYRRAAKRRGRALGS